MSEAPEPAPVDVPEREVLRELVECLRFMRQRGESYTEAFERSAAAFYQETGLLAPGKSLPLEMATEEMDDRRNARHQEWTAARNERTWAAMDKAIELLATKGARP